MRVEISFRWFLRIVGIIVLLVSIILHQIGFPVGKWLWDLRIFQPTVPEALTFLLVFFGLPWIWPGGK